MVIARKEQKKEDTWDISTIYITIDKWQEDIESLLEKKPWEDWDQYKDALSDKKALFTLLNQYFSIVRHVEKMYTYAHLFWDQDLSNDKAKDAFNKATTLVYAFQAKTAWIEPKIIQISKEKIDEIIKDPLLQPFAFYLEKLLRLKAHVLSPDQEKLLAEAGKSLEAPHKTFSSFNNADLRFPSIADSQGKMHELTQGTYLLYQRNADRELRKNAFFALHGRYKEFENTCSDLVDAQVESLQFIAKARKYDSTLQAALYPKNVDQAVYTNLIQTVRQKKDSLHKYLSMKKKLLNVPSMHFYDIYAPVSRDTFSMTLEAAKKSVVDSVGVLGEEYQSVLQAGLCNNRWCDFYENIGKRSGAYSSGCYDTAPYILMNYHNTLNDVFTLAHEAGHSMHSYYSRQHQPYQYAQYPIFVAEVASTFSEQLLFRHLLEKTTDKEQKISILTHKLEMIQATLFRQTLFADFELQIHQKAMRNEALTATALNDLYQNLYKEYYGDSLTWDTPLFSEWARIPHFYYNFYVYQYATGISAALYLARNIDPKAYIAFISSGGSKYPLNLLQTAGVDLTNPLVIEEAIKEFDELVEEWGKLV